MKALFAPHWRLIYLFAFGLFVSGVQNAKFLLFLTACFALSVCVRHYYAQTLKMLCQKWLKFNLFTLLIWLTLTWKIGSNGVEWHKEGVALATLISLRMNLILLATWFSLMNINDVILVQAIGKLPLPQKLIQLFVLTVRYIALLGELNQKMDIAMRARGFQPKCNRRTLTITAQRVALLLIHAMVRAEKAEMALKARGFSFGKAQGKK